MTGFKPSPVLLAMALSPGVLQPGPAHAQTQISKESYIMAQTDTDFSGATISQLEQKYGPAADTARFILGPVTTEFRIRLLNHFDQADMTDTAPVISEHTWRLNDDQNLTVWFQMHDGSAVYVDHLLWAPGDEF